MLFVKWYSFFGTIRMENEEKTNVQENTEEQEEKPSLYVLSFFL